MSAIGDQIRKRREEKNLSLAELARRANLSKGHLYSIEVGDTLSPRVDVLFKIANELGTTLADLFGEDEASLSMSVNEDTGLPPTLLEFAKQESLTQSDIEMLSRIQYRGKRPETTDDWRFIFESIRRTLR